MLWILLLGILVLACFHPGFRKVGGIAAAGLILFIAAGMLYNLITQQPVTQSALAGRPVPADDFPSSVSAAPKPTLVTMPNGTVLQLPNELTPEMWRRLRSFMYGSTPLPSVVDVQLPGGQVVKGVDLGTPAKEFVQRLHRNGIELPDWWLVKHPGPIAVWDQFGPVAGPSD
jgi:hypothetical protein